MFMHAIVLSVPNNGVVERIREKHPRHYQVNPTVYLVRTDEISERIATEIGLKGETRVEGATGAVFKLNGAYSGYAAKSLWEWMNA